MIKVASIQMDCVLGEKEQNLTKALALIHEACDKGAALVVLPELFSTGYNIKDRDVVLAEAIPGETTRWMENIAKERRVHICAAILEHAEAKGIVYDTAVMVSPGGLKERYRKVFLWDAERTRFKHGYSFPVADTELGTIGMQICYEVGWPESARILTMKGAEILVYPSAFNKQRYYVWDIATRSRALENGVFLIASNRSGTENEMEFAAHSRIINPRGEIVAEATQMDEVLVSTIELGLVARQRRAVPYLRDYETAILRDEMMKW